MKQGLLGMKEDLVREAYAVLAGIPANRVTLASPKTPILNSDDVLMRCLRINLERQQWMLYRETCERLVNDPNTRANPAGWLILHPSFQPTFLLTPHLFAVVHDLNSFLFGPIALNHFAGRDPTRFARTWITCGYDLEWSARNLNDKELTLYRILRTLGWKQKAAQSRVVEWI